MGEVFSSWFCRHKDIDNLIGQTVIDVEILNGASVLMLTTLTADVYVGQCIDLDDNHERLSLGEANFKPFVVAQIYRDRHGLSKLFSTRCWVIVDENQNIHELYTSDLDLFSDVGKLSEELQLKNITCK